MSRRNAEECWGAEPCNLAVVCGAGSTARNRRLVILDYDDPDAYEKHAPLLPRTWITGTGRKGGRHIWLIAPEPLSCSKLPGLDVKGAGGYCLVPPSVHPSGASYSWLDRPNDIAEVGWDILNAVGVGPPPAWPTNSRPEIIPKSAWIILRGHERISNRSYASRSELEQAAVVAMVAADVPWPDILRAFTRYAHDATKFREKERQTGSPSAAEWLRIGFDNAQMQLRERWEAVKDTMDALLLSVPVLPVQSRTADNVRAVFSAMVVRARLLRSFRVRFSIRALAEASGISKNAVVRAVRKLRASKTIRLCNQSFVQEIREYEISTEFIGRVPRGYKEQGGDCDECTALILSAEFSRHVTHDAFRHSGLGKSGLRVWLELRIADRPLQRGEIVGAIGSNKATVSRKLALLKSVGMASPSKSGWVACPDICLDSVAAQLGTAGQAVEQVERHAADRVDYQRRQREAEIRTAGGKVIDPVQAQVWNHGRHVVTRYKSPVGDVTCHLGIMLADAPPKSPTSVIAWDIPDREGWMPELDRPRLIEHVDAARAYACQQYGFKKFIWEIAYGAGDAPLYSMYSDCALRIMRAVAAGVGIVEVSAWPPNDGHPDLARRFRTAFRNGTYGAGN